VSSSDPNGQGCPRCQVCLKKGHTANICWYMFDEKHVPDTRVAAATTTSTGAAPNWYLDSGTMDHITGKLEKLTMHERYNGTDQIRAANDAGMAIDHLGNSVIPTSTRDVVFDENMFPFSELHPNASAKYTSDVLLLPSHSRDQAELPMVDCHHVSSSNSPVFIVSIVFTATEDPGSHICSRRSDPAATPTTENDSPGGSLLIAVPDPAARAFAASPPHVAHATVQDSPAPTSTSESAPNQDLVLPQPTTVSALTESTSAPFPALLLHINDSKQGSISQKSSLMVLSAMRIYLFLKNLIISALL
jgi:hypothetical protein